MRDALEDPIVFEEFVPDEEFEAASQDIVRTRFGFGAISTNPHLPIWRGEIENTSLAVQIALRSVRKLTGAAFRLVSCHVNLQTHGLDGAFHTDVGDPAGHVTHALNWYVHPYDWPVEWGGYLIIGDDARNLRAVLPVRNSAVLLPATIPHCAMSPSLSAGPMARISVALKLRLNHEV